MKNNWSSIENVVMVKQQLPPSIFLINEQSSASYTTIQFILQDESSLYTRVLCIPRYYKDKCVTTWTDIYENNINTYNSYQDGWCW